MTTITENKNVVELLELLNLEDYNSKAISLLAKVDFRYLRDMKMNLKKILASENLAEKEIYLLAISIAANDKNDVLLDAFTRKVSDVANAEEIAEAIACASLLSSNNVLYRFRHFVDKEKYHQVPARLRMNIMAKPVMGSEFFELMSLAVSAVNGCELCVKSHEESLIKMDVSEERIFDAIRLASVVVSLSKLIK